MGDFFRNQNTDEFIKALAIEENLKHRNSTYLKTRGRNGGTWMHPYLFVKFAMWLNPKFEVKVIKFVYDNLIAFRNDAGDNYRSLAQSASSFEGCDYSQIAKALNYIVFGKHKKGIRQQATEEQLEEINNVQEKLCFAIDMGYINNYQDLIITMRKMWLDKHRKF